MNPFISTKVNFINKNKMNYRPDIDGLRALAVLFVIGFHNFPGWFRGGFLGVDIFFVISGYLITGLIINEIKVKNSFNLIEFYVRRIKRIYPSLITILLFSIVIGYLILLPDEYIILGSYIAGASIFVTNFQLIYESGYFDTLSNLKPLLHLWSLGVEEQYYAIWPLIILLFLNKKKFLIKYLFIFSSILFVTSFTVHIIVVNISQINDFYLPITRLWELMSGSMLAFKGNHVIKINKSDKELYGVHRLIFEFLILICIIILLFSLLLFQDINLNWIPVLATILLIDFGRSSKLYCLLLENKLLVYIGLISFPLYLWHWPILSFVNILEDGIPSKTIRITLIFIAFILSWATFVFIENPIRRNKFIKTKYIFISLIIIGLVGIIIIMLKGLPNRIQYDELAAISVSQFTAEEHLSIKSNELKGQSDKGVIFVLGDSHAGGISDGLKINGINNIITRSHATCIPFRNIETFRLEDVSLGTFLPTKYFPTGCQKWVSNTLEEIKKTQNIKLVIITSFFNNYFDGRTPISSIGLEAKNNEEIIKKRMYETIDELSEAGIRLLLIVDVPEIYKPCQIKRPNLTDSINNCTVSKNEEFNKSYIQINTIKSLQIKYPNILIYDPRTLLCDVEKCYSKINDKYVYQRDGNHLSPAGIRLIGKDLKNQYFENNGDDIVIVP